MQDSRAHLKPPSFDQLFKDSLITTPSIGYVPIYYFLFNDANRDIAI